MSGTLGKSALENASQNDGSTSGLPDADLRSAQSPPTSSGQDSSSSRKTVGKSDPRLFDRPAPQESTSGNVDRTGNRFSSRDIGDDLNASGDTSVRYESEKMKKLRALSSSPPSSKKLKIQTSARLSEDRATLEETEFPYRNSSISVGPVSSLQDMDASHDSEDRCKTTKSFHVFRRQEKKLWISESCSAESSRSSWTVGQMKNDFSAEDQTKNALEVLHYAKNMNASLVKIGKQSMDWRLKTAMIGIKDMQRSTQKLQYLEDKLNQMKELLDEDTIQSNDDDIIE